jgi:hypothetical protein
MTVTEQSALAGMRASVHRLLETVRELVLIADEDQPRDCHVHLITLVRDAALDIAAEAEQADAALRSLAETAQRLPIAKICGAAARSQQHLIELGLVLTRDLAEPERLNDLASLGGQHGREAGAWAAEILRSVQACQHVMWAEVQPAVLAYWGELADLIGRMSLPADRERKGSQHA